MGEDLATRAELVKLARALGASADEVAFAAALPHTAIRRLRERAVGVLYDEHRSAFRRVAAITRLLPTAVNVRITLRAFPPLLAARVAGEMPPERAAELANRMPVDYLAEACLHLDPRRATALVQLVRPDSVLAIVRALVDRGEFITLGRLLDSATASLVRDVAATVPTDALLRIGFYAESDEQLTHAVALLPPARMRAIVRDALSGPPELRAAGLRLVGRLTDDELRGRLAEYATESTDETLISILQTAIDTGAVRELLVAVAAMGEPAQRRVLALSALAEPRTLGHLVRGVERHNLWLRMAPTITLMDPDLRRRFAEAANLG
ncbi:hypothetical protein [Actinophytocola sp.]|uniref:hypothetical protein n=1 Tax=Actinophytocola sp. TaxID=1872138 RepID=UPI002ED12D12